MRIEVCAAAIVAAIWSVNPSAAQDADVPGLPNTSAGPGTPIAHNGAGVFHGNYCGVGDRGQGLPPVDALDSACMHHDACTPSGGLPPCGCNVRFQQETHAVATSDDIPDAMRSLAGAVEASIPLIPCR